MKKLFLSLCFLFCLAAAYSFDYAEKQDNGSMVYWTKDVKEIENYLNVNLEDYKVVPKKCDNSQADNNDVCLMIIYPDNTWQVVTFADNFIFVFVPEKVNG
jgi:hypothetical protein